MEKVEKTENLAFAGEDKGQVESENVEQQDEVTIEVSANDDGTIGYIKLIKQGPNPMSITKEQLEEALKNSRIIFGVKEDVIEKLAIRPIYNIRIEVAKGQLPIVGKDGENIYFVKKNMDYKPEFNSEGIIDYKNIDYFQMVKKDQKLCEIIKEKPGVEGKNVYGSPIPARSGKPPTYPVGENTLLIEEGSFLIAACDGIVNYVRDTISIKDTLKITSSVDQHTGNVNFSGNATVDFDICNGFSATVGGDLIVKGVVEDANVQVKGNLHVSKGINGALNNSITVEGDLVCNYIENAIVHVEGNITADYIIDSKVTCNGDITLKGSKELVLGGDIKLKGCLKAKDIGSEKERPTRIEIIGEKIRDSKLIEELSFERDYCNKKAVDLIETATKLNEALAKEKNDTLVGELSMAKRDMVKIRERINDVTHKIQKAETTWIWNYTGSIECKRKLYQGVKVFFGDNLLRFSIDNIEHCRIYWYKGEITHSTL